MLFIDVKDMKADETANNSDANTEPTWSNATEYDIGEYVQFNGFIWYSADTRNQGNQPDTSPLEWQIVRGLNRDSVYDVYPDTFTFKTGGDLVLKHNVTNVDTIFLGNIHGNQVTVNAGGTDYVKTIDSTSISPLTVWGLNGLKEIADFYIEVPMFSGTITITISKATSTNNAGLGFLNYGIRENMGCTLLDAIQYNVKTGVDMTSFNIDFYRGRSKGYTEMILPIKIRDGKRTKDIISLLAKYAGTPILVIGDDLGVRAETIFHGVYTHLEAKITEWNHYSLTLRSLSYDAFVPPTDIEIGLAKSAKAKEEANNPTPTIDIFAGVPSCADFGNKAQIIFDETQPRNSYYCDGTNTNLITPSVDHLTTVPTVADFTDGVGRDVIFNGCTYYTLQGGVVTKCESAPKVTSKNGVPSVADFQGGSVDFIFNRNVPCDLYYLVGSTVTKCETAPAITAYTGVPPASAFNGGVDFIFDRSSPCDVYYITGGVVTKCSSGSSGGGGSGGVGFTSDSGHIGRNEVGGDLNYSPLNLTHYEKFIILDACTINMAGGGLAELRVNGTAYGDGDSPLSLNASDLCVANSLMIDKITIASIP